MPIRTTEQAVPDRLREFLPQLIRLTADQPTTSEIEEAITVSRAITTELLTWVSARHLNQCHATQSAGFRMRFPELVNALETIPVATPAEEEELDRIEHSHAHPHFAPILDALKGIA